MNAMPLDETTSWPLVFRLARLYGRALFRAVLLAAGALIVLQAAGWIPVPPAGKGVREDRPAAPKADPAHTVLRRLQKRPKITPLAFLKEFRVYLVYLGLIFTGTLVLMRRKEKVFHRAWWRKEAPPPPPWTLWDGLQVAVFFLAAHSLLAAIHASEASPNRLVALMLILYGGVMFYALLLLAGKGPAAWRALGLNGENFLRRLRESLAAYLAFVPLFVLAALINGVLVALYYEALGQPSTDLTQQAVKYLIHPDLDPRLRALFWIYAALIGPLAEEVWFRGLLQGGLRRHFSWPVAALAAGVLFGAIHLDGFRLLPLAALGVYLGGLRERTGSLTVPVLVHAIHNCVTLGFLLGAT